MDCKRFIDEIREQRGWLGFRVLDVWFVDSEGTEHTPVARYLDVVQTAKSILYTDIYIVDGTPVGVRFWDTGEDRKLLDAFECVAKAGVAYVPLSSEWQCAPEEGAIYKPTH